MLHNTAAQIIVYVFLAHHCFEAVGRLTKRNGFVYQIPVASVQHGGGDLFEPQSQHAPTNHESSESEGSNYVDYHIEAEAIDGHVSDGGKPGKAGYSIGSGLRSIAQGSADQAYTAVVSQHAAAKQAAFIAKNTLAQAATQAAATAQAALEGKEVLLQELQQQTAEAQRALSRELEQLKSARLAAKLSQQAAQAANNHISVLTAAVNNAKAVAEHAAQTANEVSNQLASQSAMVGQAKSRLEQLEQQFQQASIDYEATKEAALKAASSAAEAQVNASKAAAHATLGLHESAQPQANNIHREHYDDSDNAKTTNHHQVRALINNQHVAIVHNGHAHSIDRTGQNHKQ
uniref:Uncharacterized protein n=1 Tax=Glossina palpalis gambiensis TaxID=67801 RepID=A0A1B0BY32_9MUSC